LNVFLAYLRGIETRVW